MKKRIRKTGETVKIIVYSNIRGSDRDDTDFVYYIDSKGVEHYENRLNMCLDFEDVVKVPNAHINWEKVRIKAAISALQGFASNSHGKCVDADTGTLARWSILNVSGVTRSTKTGRCLSGGTR